MLNEPLFSQMTLAGKRAKALEIFRSYGKPMLPISLMSECQDDFKLCSLLAYLFTAEYFNGYPEAIHDKADIARVLFPEQVFPLPMQIWLPVRYCGGNMVFGRVFSVNICAFSSPDSIIGFKDNDSSAPYGEVRVLKGMKFIGNSGPWALYKLDVASTDDMTAMFYTNHEKNFTIEIAHFPHDDKPRVLFSWEDC